MLDGVLGHVARVRRRATGHHDDLVDRAQLRLRDAQLVEGEVAVLEAAAQGLLHRGRLFVDLLLHEGGVAAGHGGLYVPVHLVGLVLHGRAEEVRDLHPVRPHAHDLVLADRERRARAANERGHVRAEEVLALPDADDERGVASGSHQAVRLGLRHGDDRERAVQPGDDLPHGGGEVTVLGHERGKKVGDDLRVGLGGEDLAGGDQLGA